MIASRVKRQGQANNAISSGSRVFSKKDAFPKARVRDRITVHFPLPRLEIEHGLAVFEIAERVR